MTAPLTADEIRRACELVCTVDHQDGAAITYEMPVDGPCWVVVTHENPELDPDELFALAACLMAKCAEAGWRLNMHDDGLTLVTPCEAPPGAHPVSGWFDDQTPLSACDHTNPLSVATAQVRVALEVLG